MRVSSALERRIDTKNRYSRQNCVGNYFPYVNDIVKYPLTALPVMYEVSE